MNEIFAVINPCMMAKTRDALDLMGFSGMSVNRVVGRGVNDVNGELKAKRLVNILVPKEDSNLVVELISKINHTGEIDDGKIFVTPVEDVYTVRTKSKGLD